MKQVKEVEPHLVRVSEFAKIVGVSDRSLRYIIMNKGLPVIQGATSKSSQQINCPEAIAWWIQQEIVERGLQAPGAAVPGAPGKVIDVERLRKMRAETEKIETENRVRAGELLEASEVRIAYEAASIMLKSQLDGLAGKMGAGNAARRNRYQEVFRDLLVSYQGELRACFSDPEFVETPASAAE